MAVEEFKEGYYYRVWPPTSEVPPSFVEDMEPMLDGKWRKCIRTIKDDKDDKDETGASFEGIESGVWWWDRVMYTMQEFPAKEILKGLINGT